MTQDTIRLTTAQAIIRYLDAQYIEIDGEEMRVCGGGFGIFGHGNVTCLGEALYDHRETLPLYRGQNEQGMGFAAAGYAKQWLRRRFMFCTASAGPGTANLLTAAALAHANRLPMLMLCGDAFLTRLPDPVLQQLEHFGNPTFGTNDAFKAVSRFWDRITHPAQIIQSLPAALNTMLDPADCGPAFIGLPQDVQGWTYDYPTSFFLQDFTTGSWTAFAQDAKIIALNVGRHDATKHLSMPIVGDAKLGLTALGDAMKDYSASTDWVEFAQDARGKWNAYLDDITTPGNGPNSYCQAIRAVNDQMGPRDRVVAAAGGLPAEVTAHWQTKGIGTVDVEFGFSCMGYEIAGVGFSCMGYEIAGGWGARIAQAEREPENETVVFCGDGGFAVINKLQNNTGNESFNNLIADTPTVPDPFAVDFEAHAAAMGANAETVANPVEFAGAFKRAKAADKTSVIVMNVDAYDGWTTEGHTWWEVGTPHITDNPKVAEKHAEIEADRAKQRRGV